ncbi:integrin beta-PS-like [Coccinella septempunctata]|uniref:integrin beta-PS-like n=1 Tax=Coccinella septempunctata TaxID=41139 RepID=UPI001D078D2D|nr:integrin beta-PS-like [Coccinella septempunctata]
MSFFKFRLLAALCVIIFMTNVFAQKPSECSSRIDCSSCLQQSTCVWCLQPKLKNPLPHNKSKELNHCMPIKSPEIECANGDMVNPKTEAQVVQNRPLRSKSGSIVQIKPQSVNLTLRVGHTIDVKFQFSQAENYPVDLYYIIDNSFSMAVHKAKLAKLGEELSRTMIKLTNDFRIGFGSFIDKKAAPFVNQVPLFVNQPCAGCVPAYGFKNHLSLTPDFNLFSKTVENAKLSGNLDSPEGGFDAIMQAIVCKKEIGWRPQARHLIIFSSDAEFHIAGDGKLVGVLEPNDARCYMKDNQYDGLEKDYPSVSHLSQILKENNINLIFAIVKSRKSVLKSYKKLSENIENTKIDGLDADSKNVVKLVVENYKEIVGSVSMESNATDNIQVKITPHCKHPIRNGCARVALGEVVDFTASITLLDCAKNTSSPTYISIKPDALDESLILVTNTICGCDCESSSHSSYKKNSDKCGGVGDLVCGVCKCDKGHQGTKCECNSTSSTAFNETACRDVKPGSKTCSGLGKCECGECHCKINPHTGQKYRGKFCECDDASCEIENGKLCNGKGTCDCGKCHCIDGWKGSSCGCQDQNELCVKGGDTLICSGRGSCECGKCICTGNYTGRYCEVCPYCDGECEKLKDCVQCTVFGTVIRDRSKCQRECIAYDIKSTKESIVKDEEEEKICRAFDDDRCEILYKYMYDDLQKLTVIVQKMRNCPPNILVYVIAVSGFVLLIGVITLLIWKLATMLHDKREYEKFTKEQKDSKWHSDGNPLYKGATTTFHNPYYTE